ncbi:hypothetical protein A2U01_0076786 [Trifolium medium]|uniref:Uncharacterized protein n=1 Tax=Trifolium medium TaxID=97028 RepID=A0A392T5G7_9FABA|nr:hypothetical protein [Trifolium medium]
MRATTLIAFDEALTKHNPTFTGGTNTTVKSHQHQIREAKPIDQTT